MSNTFARIPVALFAGLIAAACAHPRNVVSGVPPFPTDVAPPASPILNSCLVVAPPDAPRDTVTVVVDVRNRPWSGARSVATIINANTSAAASARASAFVLAQLYQPLVRVLCDGSVVPEVAERWVADTNGREVHFVLRRNMRFNDGELLTLDDVEASWGSRIRSNFVFAGVDSGRPVPRQTVRISMFDADGAALSGFGQLVRAISRKNMAAEEWPVGTGPFVVDTAASKSGSAIFLRPAAARAGPVVIVREDTSADRRDLIDRGVDILETRDPLVVDYARRGGMQLHPLPFDRTYVIAFPRNSRVDSMVAVGSVIQESDAAAFRAALARDAIRVEARAATSQSWWNGRSCSAVPSASAPGASTQQSSTTIAYDANDSVARSIAERLVAIAGVGNVRPGDRDAQVVANLIGPRNAATARALVAVPVDANMLRTGSALAFVIAVPVHALAPCASFAVLRQSLPWLSANGIFPLVDTRSFLVTGKGAPAVVVDWDGTLRILPNLPPRGIPEQ